MLLDKMVAVANGYRHQDFERTEQLAIFYNQIVTLEGQDALLLQYKARETDEQKKQRAKITKSRTKDVCQRILAQYDYVKGAQRLNELIDHKDDRKGAAIRGIVSRFAGELTLQQWLEEKQRFFSAIDPNAWVVITPTFDGGFLQSVYPTTFPSFRAYDFEAVGGVTNYLVTGDKGKTVDGLPFRTFYGWQGGLYIAMYEQVQGRTDYPQDAEFEILPLKDATYRVYTYGEQSTMQTPAHRFGYLLDYATEGRTFVGIFDAASEQFKDLINRKSEYDLTQTLHAFMQRMQVGDACAYHPENEPMDRCEGGYLKQSGKQCAACGGTGVNHHITSQDILYFAKPKVGEDQHIPLSDRVAYVQMPFEIVTHQQQEIDRIVNSIPTSLFGVDINTRPNGNATATEINNFYDSLNNALAAFGDKISDIYKNIVRNIAAFAGDENGVSVSHRYPRQFRKPTVAELMVMLKQAKDSGASSDVQWAIQKEILTAQNSDSPDKIVLAEIKHSFKPFKELTEQERTLRLSQLAPNNDFRLLHDFFDTVFERVLDKNPNFVLTATRSAQWEQIKAVLAELRDETAMQIPTFPTE